MLRGVNLEIKAGNISAIVGPSGAGKSTLVSLLLRLSDPSSGRVSIDGEDLRNFSVSSLIPNVDFCDLLGFGEDQSEEAHAFLRIKVC